jgi:hypothetical protein
MYAGNGPVLFNRLFSKSAKLQNRGKALIVWRVELTNSELKAQVQRELAERGPAGA